MLFALVIMCRFVDVDACVYENQRKVNALQSNVIKTVGGLRFLLHVFAHEIFYERNNFIACHKYINFICFFFSYVNHYTRFSHNLMLSVQR